jgi:hypothetical protein
MCPIVYRETVVGYCPSIIAQVVKIIFLGRSFTVIHCMPPSIETFTEWLTYHTNIGTDLHNIVNYYIAQWKAANIMNNIPFGCKMMAGLQLDMCQATSSTDLGSSPRQADSSRSSDMEATIITRKTSLGVTKYIIDTTARLRTGSVAVIKSCVRDKPGYYYINGKEVPCIYTADNIDLTIIQQPSIKMKLSILESINWSRPQIMIGLGMGAASFCMAGRKPNKHNEAWWIVDHPYFKAKAEKLVTRGVITKLYELKQIPLHEIKRLLHYQSAQLWIFGPGIQSVLQDLSAYLSQEDIQYYRQAYQLFTEEWSTRR